SLPGQPFCAIKQLCPRVSEKKALDTARHRFQREAKILAALGNHSRIPMLLDYFVLGDEFYLVQEYIKGATLARLVRRQGCQSELTVKRVLREMLDLLLYVHERGVIHRDIKPQNIILSQDRRLVLIDFGAVKQQLAQMSENTTRGVTTHFVGTVGFAPPEQFSLRPVFASDIYALGVTSLYLLTGKAPLDFKTNPRTGKLQWQERASVGKILAPILDKMLEPSLERRYQSVDAIINDLNLASPQDNLSQCMNNLTPPINKESQSRQSPEASQRPLSEKERMARSIRNWKSRRPRPTSKSTKYPDSLLHSSG
ncbi:serine/threonine-protein kinase, partial [Spirulina sp. 06S082]|uniref:serine/threonine-protein kinase n=1 Tax=Spirulina sp. 06S082 TaxID=3110248 RepID=UPI002B1F60CF